VRLQINHAPRARDRRVLRRRLLQPHTQEGAQRQRVGRSPGDAALGVLALEVPESAATGNTGPAIDWAARPSLRNTGRIALPHTRRTPRHRVHDSTPGRTDALATSATCASRPTSPACVPGPCVVRSPWRIVVRDQVLVDPFNHGLLVLLCQIRRSISVANRFDLSLVLIIHEHSRYAASQCSIAQRPPGCADC